VGLLDALLPCCFDVVVVAVVMVVSERSCEANDMDAMDFFDEE
jgi:hypothetical protein